MKLMQMLASPTWWYLETYCRWCIVPIIYHYYPSHHSHAMVSSNKCFEAKFNRFLIIVPDKSIGTKKDTKRVDHIMCGCCSMILLFSPHIFVRSAFLGSLWRIWNINISWPLGLSENVKMKILKARKSPKIHKTEIWPKSRPKVINSPNKSHRDHIWGMFEL